MNSTPLIENDNINNMQQFCKGCEKNLPSSSFIAVNGKSYRTCNNCRTKNKAVYQRKLISKQENDADNDQIIVEFHDFYDFFADNYNLFECAIHDKDEQENSENLEFKVSCIVDVNTLEGNPKDQAGRIIEIISDIDEYTWM
jgi:hypothetical protein